MILGQYCRREAVRRLQEDFLFFGLSHFRAAHVAKSTRYRDHPAVSQYLSGCQRNCHILQYPGGSRLQIYLVLAGVMSSSSNCTNGPLQSSVSVSRCTTSC